jgi:hypothetical protein
LLAPLLRDGIGVLASEISIAVVDMYACLHAAPAMFSRNCTTPAPLDIR